ncbi:MAG: hypothetical protein HYS46_03415 [Betaproteobacteria bacterium]|nr:hypothetical protein [Betaproteobacteria bacterium]
MASSGAVFVPGLVPKWLTVSAMASPNISNTEAPRDRVIRPPCAFGETGWPELIEAWPPANLAEPLTWLEVVVAAAPPPADWWPNSVTVQPGKARHSNIRIPVRAIPL